MSQRFDANSSTGLDNHGRSIGQSNLAERRWSDDAFHRVFESMRDGIAIVDDQGEIVLVNAQTERLFGYARHELPGQRVEILVPERFRGQLPRHAATYLADPHVRPMDSGSQLYGLRKDGSEFPVEIGLSPVETEDGVLVAAVIRDVTDREQAAAAVREARILAEAIVETVRQPLLVLNAELRVQSANRSFYQAFQATPQETENRLVYELGNHQWDIPQLRDLLEHVLPEKSQFIDFEVQHCFDHIGQRTMLLNARAILREGGRPGLILVAIEDITERKRAEQQLARLAAELQQSNQKLKRSNRELQDFAHVVSHDLRAPLVNIQGFSKELALSCERLWSVAADVQVPEAGRRELSALLHEDIPESLDFIITSAAKMDSLLSGVLQLSRVGRPPLTIRQLDMNQMLSEIVASMQFAIEQAGASVQVGSVPPCQGDQMQINQVFSNLLNNALKYLDPNRRGVIRVCGQEEPDRVVYSIEDNGIGIAAEHLDSIYKIFHRLDPRRGTGDGLGLNIVRRVLDRHRGKIWVESEVNQGSKFYVSLPKG
jgi:PAS domain S-box-containing protein